MGRGAGRERSRGNGATLVNTVWQMGRRRRQRPRGSWLLVAVVVIVSA